MATQLKMGFQKNYQKLYHTVEIAKNVTMLDSAMMLIILSLISLTYVTSRKQYLMYLINMLQSNKNIFEQIKPLL